MFEKMILDVSIDEHLQQKVEQQPTNDPAGDFLD